LAERKYLRFGGERRWLLFIDADIHSLFPSSVLQSETVSSH
jgi:hypothetical protein